MFDVKAVVDNVINVVSIEGVIFVKGLVVASDVTLDVVVAWGVVLFGADGTVASNEGGFAEEIIP